MPGESQRFGRLLEFLGMMIIIAASIAVVLLIIGIPSALERPVWTVSPIMWFAIAILYFAGIIALKAAYWPFLILRNENLILLKRRLFRNSNVEERIPIGTIAKVRLRPLSGRYAREGPIMIIELADGSRFRISRSRMEEKAYATLSQMADREDIGAA